MSYIVQLHVFDSKSDMEFLILDFNIEIFLKIKKDIGFMTPRWFNIYIKPLLSNTQEKKKVRIKRRDYSSN